MEQTVVSFPPRRSRRRYRLQSNAEWRDIVHFSRDSKWKSYDSVRRYRRRDRRGGNETTVCSIQFVVPEWDRFRPSYRVSDHYGPQWQHIRAVSKGKWN